MRLLTAFLCGILSAFPVLASDHIDGPVTTSHRVADLTDLYAFPTPGARGSMTILLNAYPLVPRTGHFTDKVTYTVIVRRATITESTNRTFFETSDEVRIDCTFKTPNVTAEHVVLCRSSNGLHAENKYDVVPVKNNRNDFLLYAGMRADPFFFNADFATDAIKGKLDPPDDSNVMSGANVLTIAIQIEVSLLYEKNPPSLLAVAAETTTRDSPGAPLRRLDRVGRPEITNVSMAPRNEPDLRDLYNLERPFQVPAPRQRIYQEKLARNIALYDTIDGRRDWRDRDREALAALIADDFLVVDVSKPCQTLQSFFEIEKAAIRHRPHETCGGRKPNDDIMDILFTMYVAGMNGNPVRDGVSHPAKAVSAKFPYLAPPDLGFWSTVKVSLARVVLGIPKVR